LKCKIKLNTIDPIYSEMDFVTIGYIIEKIKKVHGRPNTGASGHSGKLQNRGGIFSQHKMAQFQTFAAQN
jgi:hypothetical protein